LKRFSEIANVKLRWNFIEESITKEAEVNAITLSNSCNQLVVGELTWMKEIRTPGAFLELGMLRNISVFSHAHQDHISSSNHTWMNFLVY